MRAVGGRERERKAVLCAGGRKGGAGGEGGMVVRCTGFCASVLGPWPQKPSLTGSFLVSNSIFYYYYYFRK